jgi:hypothetical protein
MGRFIRGLPVGRRSVTRALGGTAPPHPRPRRRHRRLVVLEGRSTAAALLRGSGPSCPSRWPRSSASSTGQPADNGLMLLGIHIPVAVQWQKESAGDWASYAANISRRVPENR